jgi:peptide subunit release factor 1 (eRF1)
VEAAASKLNQSLQEQELAEVVDLARSGGKGALGADPVLKALKESRVDTLFLSRGFIRANPEYADHLVGAAFEQHAEVEELSYEGAERLDTEGEGVAARLRYTI